MSLRGNARRFAGAHLSKYFFIIHLIGILSILSGCSDAPVGSKKRPFTMYFIPSVDSNQITRTSEQVTSFVAKAVSQKLYGKDSGFYVKGAVPQSYIAVVEAFGTKKADFAAMTTFSYVLARDVKNYDLEAALIVLRGNEEHSYKAQIIANVDSGIKSLKDLEGKKFAFVDPASTTGYVLPSKLLKENKINLGQTVFGYKHDSVVTMVYQKQVDAGATYYSDPVTKMVNGKLVKEITDARARVKTQFPDVEEKVKIIGFTEEVPNEPWVLRANLFPDPVKNEKVKNAVIDALLDFSKTPAGIEMLKVVATGTGLERVSDRNYDDIRRTILDTNLNLEEILKPSKKG